MERKTRFELATLALARRCSTPEPLPHVELVEGDGFEPSKAQLTDLQSAPFGHSGIPPNSLVCRNGRLSGVDRKDAGAKSCVARVCGLLRLDFPFCNSNPQHLVMTDE